MRFLYELTLIWSKFPKDDTLLMVFYINQKQGAHYKEYLVQVSSKTIAPLIYNIYSLLFSIVCFSVVKVVFKLCLRLYLALGRRTNT